MFSFNSLHRVSHRRFFAQCVFTMTILALVFLFAACSDVNSNDDNGDETSSLSLDGTWLSEFDDGYTINQNAKTLEYDDGGWGFDYAGTIASIEKFNSDGSSGIIFIKYTKKPNDWKTGEPPAGDYIGIYYRNLTKTQGEFTMPSTEAEPVPAKATLEEAKTTFTVDTMGSYVSFWSVCIKQ